MTVRMAHDEMPCLIERCRTCRNHADGDAAFAFMSHMHKAAARPLSYLRPGHALYASCLLKHNPPDTLPDICCIPFTASCMLLALCPRAQNTNHTLSTADWTCIAVKHSKMCASQQRSMSVWAPLQELTEVHIALPAPLVCHEQAAGLGEHEGMDGTHMVHSSQARRLL